MTILQWLEMGIQISTKQSWSKYMLLNKSMTSKMDNR